MKNTILFSNIVGDCNSNDCNFNSYMEEYLINNYSKTKNLIFIDAPGLGDEDKWFDAIIKCFKNASIVFDKVVRFTSDSEMRNISDVIDDNTIIFLMGGNPITQREIIKRNNLDELIKNYIGLVIGFCAGAINLSEYSIITTDDDFPEPSSYIGIGRVPLTIEPHYNMTESELDLERRNNEINEFSKKHNTEILAIPDTSAIFVEDSNILERGKIYHFNNK